MSISNILQDVETRKHIKANSLTVENATIGGTLTYNSVASSGDATISGTTTTGGITFDSGANILSNFIDRTFYLPTISDVVNCTGTPLVSNGFYYRLGPIVQMSFVVGSLSVSSAGILTSFRFTTPLPAVLNDNISSGSGRHIPLSGVSVAPIVVSDWSNLDPTYAKMQVMPVTAGACNFEVSCWYWA